MVGDRFNSPTQQTRDVCLATTLLLIVAGSALGPAAAEVPTPRSRTGHESADAIVFHGRVVNPEGQPFVGARLYLNYFNWSERDAARPLRTTSDADGRFRFSVEKSYFESQIATMAKRAGRRPC